MRMPATAHARCESSRPCVCRKHLSDHGVGLLQAPPELLIQEEARELGCAGAFEELDEDLPCGALRRMAGAHGRRSSEPTKGQYVAVRQGLQTSKTVRL